MNWPVRLSYGLLLFLLCGWSPTRALAQSNSGVAPSDGMTVSTRPAFTWTRPGATLLLISNSREFDSATAVRIRAGAGYQYNLNTELKPGSTYYWKVLDSQGTTLAEASFRTESQSSTLEKPTLYTPAIGNRGRIGANSLGKSFLEWSDVPGATDYRVEVMKDRLSAGSTPEPFKASRDYSAGPRQHPVFLDGNNQQQEYRDRWFAHIVLPSGAAYRWRVVAIRGNDEQPSDEKIVVVESNLLDRLRESGLHLQRALPADDTQATDPATVGFTHEAGHATTVQSNFALIWKTTRPLSESGFLHDSWASMSVEGKLTGNGKDRANNSLKFVGSLQHQALFGGAKNDTRGRDPRELDPDDLARGTALLTDLNIKFEGDQDFASKKLLGEILTTFSDGHVIGMYLPHSRFDRYGQRDPFGRPIQFRIRPYVGVDGGDNIAVGDSKEKKGTVLRLIARMHGDIRLNFLAKALGLRNGVDLFGDATYYHLPLENGPRDHTYLESGINFSLTKDVSLSFSYKVGEDAPLFQHGESFGGQFGVKF